MGRINDSKRTARNHAFGALHLVVALAKDEEQACHYLRSQRIKKAQDAADKRRQTIETRARAKITLSRIPFSTVLGR